MFRNVTKNQFNQVNKFLITKNGYLCNMNFYNNLKRKNEFIVKTIPDGFSF